MKNSASLGIKFLWTCLLGAMIGFGLLLFTDISGIFSRNLSGGSLYDRLSLSQNLDYVIPLTPGEHLDLLIVADPGCSDCEDFTRSTLDGLVYFSRSQDLTVGYLVLGFRPYSRVVMSVSSCLSQMNYFTAENGAASVRSLQVLSAFLEQQENIEIGALLPDIAGIFNVDSADLEHCLENIDDDMIDFRMRSFNRMFDAESMPTFYLQRPGERTEIEVFPGYLGGQQIIRDIRGFFDRSV